MTPVPPKGARRLLERALAGDPAGAWILGDLHEDFVRLAGTRGPRAARRWYMREAVSLAISRRVGRVLRGSPKYHATPATPAAPATQAAKASGGLATLLQDAGFAGRVLRRSPGFTLFTAGIIGLGVGAATAVFSVLRPLVLAPLPLEQAESLVWVANTGEPGDRSLSAVTSRSSNLRDFRERAQSFEGLTGYNAFFEQTAYTLTGSGEPARLVGVGVAHDFLDVLRVRPLHGRSFTAEEGQWGGPPAVILTHAYWRSRFAADPSMVGRDVVLNGVARTVVGVLPPTFDFASLFTPGKRVDFLLPFAVSEETDWQGNTMSFVGRLRPGVSAREAQAELDVVIATLQAEDPRRWGLGAVVTPLREHVAGPIRAALLLLAVAAGTLLLIACVNVANLILARSPGRAREVAVRKALGATRGRVARQLVLETLGISLAGAAVGAGLAWAATRVVAATAGIEVPLLNDVTVDGGALLFAGTVAVLAGLLVGLVPAVQARQEREADVLRGATRGNSGGREARRLREVLVMAEVTLACVLLVSGGLLVRSFRAVMEVDLGFEPANAVAWQLNPSTTFESLAHESAFYANLTERVAAVPGVEEVGLIDALPLGRNRTWGFRVVGVPYAEDTNDAVFPHMIDAGYLAAMRIPLRAGRNIAASDNDDAPPVLLMNETAAQRLFGGVQQALGRRVTLGGTAEWEVAGVVGDVRHVSPEHDAGIQMYMPMSQLNNFVTVDMVVRSRLPARQVAAAVSAALAEVDPAMPTTEFWTLGSRVDSAVSSRRFTLTILSAFSAVALLLAGLGIYGVLSQSVAERRAEIGIRIALGASATDVARTVAGRMMVLAGAGVAAGVALSLAGARLLSSLLFGVGATDPATLAGTALAILAVAALAGAVPVARAVRLRSGLLLSAD